MKRRVGLVLSAVVVLFTASCFQYAVRPMPLYEAARRPEATGSAVAGLNVGTGVLRSEYTEVYWEGVIGEGRRDRFTAAEGVVALDVGSGRWSVVGHLGFGLAQMTDTFWHPSGMDNPAGVSRRAFPFQWSGGGKVRIGEASALRLTIGTDFCFFVSRPGLGGPLLPLPSADAFFLQDFGSVFTTGVGVGLRGLQFNGVCHVPIGKDLIANASANLLYYGWPVRWSGAESRITRPIALLAGISVGTNQPLRPTAKPATKTGNK